jgi:hypothetical protein
MRFIAGVLLVIFAWAVSPANATVSEGEFFAQYETAARKLRDFYGAVTISGTLTKKNWTKDKNVAPEKVVVYADGDRVRVDVDSSKLIDGSPHDGAVRVSVVAPDTSFALTREPGANAYVLRNVTSDAESMAHALRGEKYLLFAPYKDRMGIDVLEKLKSPGTKITSIAEEKRGDELLVKVSYQEDIVFNNKPLQYIGWYLFAQDKSWALRGSFSQRPVAEAKQIWSEIEYGDTVDGIPLLKKAEYWMQKGTERSEVQKYEVTEIKPGRVPEREFQLAAFGIRDIREERETNYWLYLIVAGVVLIAAAFIVARISARRRAGA